MCNGKEGHCAVVLRRHRGDAKVRSSELSAFGDGTTCEGSFGGGTRCSRGNPPTDKCSSGRVHHVEPYCMLEEEDHRALAVAFGCEGGAPSREMLRQRGA